MTTMRRDSLLRGGKGATSLRAPPQCIRININSRGNGNGCRPSPSFHENLRQERDTLRVELEEAHRKFSVEIRELREMAKRDQQLLADKLRSKWELQQVQELQKLREETKRQREAEIRQLLRWKEAELHESQEFLRKQRDTALQQARTLQQELAKQLTAHGSGSRGTECHARLKVVGKLRCEIDGRETAQIRELEAELKLERQLFLKYILEVSDGEPVLAGSWSSFTQASSPLEGKVNSRGAAGESGPQEGWAQPGSVSTDQPMKDNASLLNALKALEKKCRHLKEETALLRENGCPDKQGSQGAAGESPPQEGGGSGDRLKKENASLLNALEALQEKCRCLEEENTLLKRNSCPPVQGRVKILKQKSAQLADIAKKLSAFDLCGLQGEDQQAEALQREMLRLQRKAPLKSRRTSLLTSVVDADGSSPSAIAQEALSTIHGGLEASSLAKKKPRTPTVSKKDGESQELTFDNETQGYKNSCLRRDSKNHLQVSEQQLVGKQKQCKNRCEKDAKEALQQVPTEVAREHRKDGQCSETEVKELQHLYPSHADWANQDPFRLRVFLARNSYNPFSGPNKNPEVELPLTAGEYVYIWGEMDEDGFYEGELMDGRRGFVPSNLVEEVAGNDLISFIPSEQSDISWGSFHEPCFPCQSAGQEKSCCPSDGPGATSREIRAAAPDAQNLSLLTLRDITATSAQITWFPSNDNYSHLVYLNKKRYDETKAGICCYTFRNLKPCANYGVKVEPLAPSEAVGCSRRGLSQKATEMTFTTLSAGPPHAPLDVRVDASSSADILVISWMPETIHPEGSSNGVKVTGYAVYISGRKVTEIFSPTAGSVSLEVSRINACQAPQSVTVRTISPFGESADSVPALIPSDLKKDTSAILSRMVDSVTAFQESFQTEGGPVPATEHADQKRSEASLTQSRIPKSKPDSRKASAMDADDSSSQSSLENGDASSLSPEPGLSPLEFERRKDADVGTRNVGFQDLFSEKDQDKQIKQLWKEFSKLSVSQVDGQEDKAFRRWQFCAGDHNPHFSLSDIEEEAQ